jgi:hypothetical protein
MANRMSFLANQSNKDDIMRKRMLNFRAVLAFFTFSMPMLPTSALAEGDGAWTTAASPGYAFLIEEDLFNDEYHMSMTVLKPVYIGGETHWGKASASGDTYLLSPLNNEASDITFTWKSNSLTQATITVELCTTNCLWQTGQVVTLNKFSGIMNRRSALNLRASTIQTVT